MTTTSRAKFIMTAVAVASFGALVLFSHGNAMAQGAATESAAASVTDAMGNMHIPPDYRTTYEFLGTWSVAGDDGKGAKQMHVVYASPGTIAAFRKTGHFPEGAVLVKEVYEATTKDMTTGSVSHEDKLVGWFLMVRDTKNNHAGNKLWGDGWGWSWFDAGNPTKTTSTDYKTDCQSCHVPARATEWIYTLGYPPLKK
ncbi:cytochrome P460 family protein [Rhodopseudomonas sp. B29]|uniref:cytochrome P460 family protein n=1 Tax=Rhodopseudomonas sp. B29 TaxID=95607 RepID=UPI000347E89A|nr:cytochrome P460 family protein [Rhodopseudomonas sp. B29]